MLDMIFDMEHQLEMLRKKKVFDFYNQSFFTAFKTSEKKKHKNEIGF